MKKLMRNSKDAMFLGVCSGIARYLNIDATIIRLLWVLFIFTGAGVLVYFLCAFIMPKDDPYTVNAHSAKQSDNTDWYNDNI